MFNLIIDIVAWMKGGIQLKDAESMPLYKVHRLGTRFSEINKKMKKDLDRQTKSSRSYR